MRRITLFLLLFTTLLALFPGPHATLGLRPRPSKRGQTRVLLVTAHPDDECMFFAPTILWLTSQPESYEVHSLCFSSGDADGLGHERKQELAGSLDVLGVPRENRLLLEHSFQDDITQFWDTHLVASHLKAYIFNHAIDIVLTFDEFGISNHPNHISLARGARLVLENPIFHMGPNQSSSPLMQPRILNLKTVGTLSKYTGKFGSVIERAALMFCTMVPSELLQAHCDSQSRKTIFYSGWGEYTLSLYAMMQHWSQLVWFRWLYVTFSQYMWVNEWSEVVIA